MEELTHKSADEEPFLIVGGISIPELAHVRLLVPETKGVSEDALNSGDTWSSLVRHLLLQVLLYFGGTDLVHSHLLNVLLDLL